MSEKSNTVGLVVKRTLDAQGLFCPEPVMMLHNAIREMAINEMVKVIATDPSTQRDIPKFCQFLGHQLIEQQKNNDVYIYTIKKSVASDTR